MTISIKRSGPVRNLGCMLALLIFPAILVSEIRAQSPLTEADEYEIKAAFLINFSQYVEWPPEAFRDSSEPLSICVLGRDPFGSTLDQMVTRKVVGGRPLVVRRLSDAKNAGSCRVLFAGSSERKSLANGALTAIGVLTVGEEGSPSSDGAVISFSLQSGKVRFTIDMAAAQRANLRLSSRLLGLASSVLR